MKKIFQALIKEKSGSPIYAAPLLFGIPLPRGRFFNHKELDLITDNNTVLLSDISITSLWPDNSIKWCLVKSQVSLGANEQIKLGVFRTRHKVNKVQCIPSCISETDSRISIKTKNCEFSFNKNKFNLFDHVKKNGHDLINHGFCLLDTKQHQTLEAKITDYQYQTTPSTECPLSAQITFTGKFLSDSNELLANFEARFVLFIATDVVKCSIALHNPKSAQHCTGLWDLGDPHSLFINSFNLGFLLKDKGVFSFKLKQNAQWQNVASHDLTIYQESSGGENWNSPNHKNYQNKVPFKLNGFVCESHNATLESGHRASPTFNIKSEHSSTSLFIENFWQNFPKSLQIDNEKLTIGLFPDQFQEGIELQPGEKKTHTFYLSFNDNKETLACFEEPPEVTLNPAWVEKSRVFPNFSTDTADDVILNIINEGLTSTNNFFNNREAIDEYGWRNFGDIFADHETDNYTGNELFISHYNNQYDPIYGFLRQYALTGEYRWFILADDLAKHIVDIDIYHTQFDKEEYNGGLFWHTDHYLDAATSSHRSYSRHQKSNAYMDHAGGGGPGGQHCYTTGLLYHYLITGNEPSKLAIKQLLDWITHVYEYERSGSIFDIVLAFKNRYRIDLKNLLTGKYPLDRGIGNYINALLDQYELTQEQDILQRVEYIIKNTVHPLDNLDDRDLSNVEISWYYTVFFQSACRYLQTKEEASRLDDSFYYVRDSLLHYADWMTENEQPYLYRPDILEFPNHTWTAQDIRKVNVLLMADYYSPGNQKNYVQKANEIYEYITSTLSKEKTRTYTRILAILMQNHGAVTFFKGLDSKPVFKEIANYTIPRSHTLLNSLLNIGITLLSAIKQFSLKREITWLAQRSEKIARLFKYQP